MLNIILYYAATADEVRQCAYSLLKYLDIYNLKPPASHFVVIYTNDPASLETYSSFFNSFVLKPALASPTEGFKDLASEPGDRVLHFAPGAYPIKPLEPLFDRLGRSGDLPPATSTQVHSTQALDPNEEFIVQYADFKEFNTLLRLFFKRHQEESVPNQVKLIHTVDAVSIRRQRDDFNQLPLLTRLIRKVSGKGWNISRHLKKI